MRIPIALLSGEHTSVDLHRYRWIMLALITGGGISFGWLRWSIVPFEILLAREFYLSASQVAFLVGIPILIIALISFPVGVATDRFGAARVALLGLAVFGVFGLARGLASGYAGLLAYQALFGVGMTFFFVSYPKLVDDWFSSRRRAVASSAVFVGSALGAAAGMATSLPLFGEDWRRAFLVLGVGGILFAVVWLFLARESAHAQILPSIGERRLSSPFQGLFEIIHIRNVWLMALGLALFLASNQVWYIFGFPYLVSVKGASQADAGGILMLTRVGYVFGSLGISLLSDRVGLRRPFITVFSCLAVVSLLLVVANPLGLGTVLSTLAFGFCSGSVNPLFYVVTAETPGVSGRWVGAASGLMLSIGDVAAFFSPVFMGRLIGSIETADAAAYAPVWAIELAIMALIAVCGWLARETGPGGKVGHRPA